jgi:hypothetical protein
VADCFKYRNKIGSEIALEALRDYLKMHRRGIDALRLFAKVCRSPISCDRTWQRRHEGTGSRSITCSSSATSLGSTTRSMIPTV